MLVWHPPKVVLLLIVAIQTLFDIKMYSYFIHFFSQYTSKEKILYMVMERGDTDLSKLIRSTKHMSVHMIMYYWSEMLTTVNEVHSKGKLL